MFSSAYIKGHSHLKCDDYAAHSDKCGFLSDGCSSAKNSDIGAKLLSFYALENINHFLYLNKGRYDFKEFIFYLENFIKENWVNTSVLKQNNIIEDLFSCTLGGIVKHNDNIYLSLLGDGCIYYELDNGEKYIVIVSFEKNYPFYISYLFTESVFNNWEQLSDNNIKIDHYKFENNEWTLIPKSIPTDTLYLTITYPLNSIKTASIFSDGVEQCNGLSTIEAINELVNFKNTNIDFAWRRLRRFEENRNKQNLYNQDDISIVSYVRDNI